MPGSRTSWTCPSGTSAPSSASTSWCPTSAAGNGDEGAAAVDEELDLRAEDDALVAAALEAEQEADEEVERRGRRATTKLRRWRRRRRRRRQAQAPPARAARRAAGARRRRQPLEGTFDHGDEGYGLWLDPAIQDDPVYAEHWAGHRPVTVTVEAERIVISRAGEEAGDDDEDETRSQRLRPEFAPAARWPTPSRTPSSSGATGTGV